MSVRQDGDYERRSETLGKIVLDKHERSDVDYKEKVDAKRKMLAENRPPPRAFADVPHQKSGNRKLGVVCSYCPFKRSCWPGLRTFLYSDGPTYLTHVDRVPEVREV